jgi:hypothetical protein
MRIFRGHDKDYRVLNLIMLYYLERKLQDTLLSNWVSISMTRRPHPYLVVNVLSKH